MLWVLNMNYLSNIIAHRGFHDMLIPENSFLAFKKAIRNNYIIELDIHLLKDGNIAVFHDFNLKRMCGVNKIIEDCTYNELLKYNLLNTKEKIPLLERVLNLVNGKVPIIIEIKEIVYNSRLEKKLSKLLSNYNGMVYIHSFNLLSLLWFRRNMCNIKGGLIYSTLSDKSLILKYNLFKSLLINGILKVDFISCNKKLLNDSYIKKIRKKVAIFAWTIKNKEEFNLYNNQSDKLICDNIDQL